MPKLTLTAKRQATFPKALCEEMNLSPGDAFEAEQRVLDGEHVWVLKPIHSVDLSWVGCLGKYATQEDPSMEEIRDRIGEGIADGTLD